jgi:hypothetical protein
MKKIWFAVIYFFCVEKNLSGQMHLLHHEDGLTINYKWDEGKSGENLLLIEVVNDNDVAVDFELSLFLMKGIQVVESTERISICAGAGKTLKPRSSGLVFDVKSSAADLDRIEIDDLNLIKANRKTCHL